MIRRITLIEPRNDHVNVFSMFLLPRLGGILLATVMRDRGYDARFLFLSRRDVLARTIDTDLIGISTLTATATDAYALGDHFRTRGIPVVFGGSHVSFLPEEALEHGDFCITGEGETGLPLLVDALNHHSSLVEVPGLVWKERGLVRRNPPAPFIEDLDSLPFPDLQLLDMGRNRKIGLQGKALPTISVQTSRGCPFNCTFCTVTGMFGRRYRHRSAANVVAELSRYDPKRCILFFSDDNFAADPGRTKELLREMIRLRLGFEWCTQVRCDVARDPEMLDLMAEAGCRLLFVGFESVNPEALLEMKKNQTVEEIRHAVREIHKRNINLHGMFVLGFDSDTVVTMNSAVRFALAEKMATAHFLILTPYPGSRFFTEMLAQGRLLDARWDTFDGQHVTFVPQRITPWELQRAQVVAHKRFYSPRHVLGRLIRGNVMAFVLGLYARALNHRWQRRERDYLRRLRLHQPAVQHENIP
jgi:radical SAM superfamily enzyme YgiQ (UPF0313 family)